MRQPLARERWMRFGGSATAGLLIRIGARHAVAKRNTAALAQHCVEHAAFIPAAGMRAFDPVQIGRGLATSAADPNPVGGAKRSATAGLRLGATPSVP